jgi:lipoyl(octanoyl) transferase
MIDSVSDFNIDKNLTLFVRDFQDQDINKSLLDYNQTHEKMLHFTQNRCDDTPDEIWLLQHPKVFTQGQAGKSEHILFAGDIPVVQSDRGGQVTYHGPGQLVVYLMIDIKRKGWGPRQLVSTI